MGNELKQSIEYKMPNGMSAFYHKTLGIGSDAYHLFLGGTPAPDCFRFHYIPVGDFELKGNSVISNSHEYETQHRPDIADRVIFELMKKQLNRLKKSKSRIK